MHKKSLEIWVGLFMLLGLGAMVMLAFKVGNVGNRGGDSYQLTAKFDNVGGLSVKAPVMIGGVRVGRVSAITIDKNDYRAVVVLDVNSYYDNLPLDSSASILTAGLLGAQFVSIEPGGEDIYLKNQSELELTQSALQLENLISQLLFSQENNGKDTNVSQ